MPTTKTHPVTDVEAHARIPDRARIIDRDTLVEYCAKMEAHLAKQAGWLNEWIEWKNPPLQEMVCNELYALLDSLASILTMIEAAGYGEMAKGILLSENAIENAAIVNGTIKSPTYRQQLIDNELWGQEPPSMSEQLRRFAFIKATIGEGAARAISGD